MYMAVYLRWIRLIHGHRLKEETEKKEYWFLKETEKKGLIGSGAINENASLFVVVVLLVRYM